MHFAFAVFASAFAVFAVPISFTAKGAKKDAKHGPGGKAGYIHMR